MFVKLRNLDSFNLYGVYKDSDEDVLEITTLNNLSLVYSDILIGYDTLNKSVKTILIFNYQPLTKVVGYFD